MRTTNVSMQVCLTNSRCQSRTHAAYANKDYRANFSHEVPNRVPTAYRMTLSSFIVIIIIIIIIFSLVMSLSHNDIIIGLLLVNTHKNKETQPKLL